MGQERVPQMTYRMSGAAIRGNQPPVFEPLRAGDCLVWSSVTHRRRSGTLGPNG